MTDSDIFSSLETAMSTGGPNALLEQLIESLRQAGRPHDLFAALRMKTRAACGLPLIQQSEEDLDEATRNQLEEGLVDACRQAAHMLIDQGKVREAWMYLRPVGDKVEARSLIGRIEADEDNIDELIEVCLHEAIDVKRGFGMVLDHYGTCNSITTMDQVVSQLPPEHHGVAASLLLEHLHDELMTAVSADVAQQEGQQPSAETLAELVADRDWLFGEHSYHVDTTHLASTVRFAETLTDEAHLRLALDLTAYGRRLHTQFQYQGDEPFADIYEAHALFFQAQLGEQVEEALEYFAEKSKLDVMTHGTMPIEVYIDLLHRIGRDDDAIRVYREQMPNDIPARGIAPTLYELCAAANEYDSLLEHCQTHDDVVGFATGLLNKNGS